MFSQPASTAIGDTNTYQVKEPRRDDEGAVITAPRNFYTTKTKKGHTDKELFSRPSYVSIGNPFKEAALGALRTIKKDAFTVGGHDRDFRPQINNKERMHKLPYDYMPLGNGKEEKKNYRDQDGAVIIQPRGMLTNPVKRGKVGKGTTIGG